MESAELSESTESSESTELSELPEVPMYLRELRCPNTFPSQTAEELSFNYPQPTYGSTSSINFKIEYERPKLQPLYCSMNQLTFISPSLPVSRCHRLSPSRCMWCDSVYSKTDEIVKFRCYHTCHERCANKFSLKTDELCYVCNAEI